jgi:uncharacterized repeat protein (TIGR03803 family)
MTPERTHNGGMMKATLTFCLTAALLIARARAQPTLTTLASFSDSIEPRGALLLGSDGSFYGTTYSGVGTVFRVTTNGAITTLGTFSGGGQGQNPYAGLTLGADARFYGTTDQDAAGGGPGTVFTVTTNGTITFQADVAAHANALALGSDGNLYGTTQYGGANLLGTVFRVTTNGDAATIADFAPVQFDNAGAYTNGTGSSPWAGLALGPDGKLYGTAPGGGGHGVGCVFKVMTNGSPAAIASFSAGGLTPDGVLTNADGESPYASLTLAGDGNFYGTTFAGGTNGTGTIFRVTTNGVLTSLVAFAAGSTNLATGFFTNANGANPWANLTLASDGSLYGTTDFGGTNGTGTIFRITTNGLFTSLISFGPAESFSLVSSNGISPNAMTLGSDGKLYGTTWHGGTNGTGFGTVFRLALNSSSGAPPLDIGLRVYDGMATNKIAAESGTPTSPFRINKNGTNYGILLVDTNSPNASKVRIQTSSGVKAWQKLP